MNQRNQTRGSGLAWTGSQERLRDRASAAVGCGYVGTRVGSLHLQLGSTVDSYKKVGSGGIPDVTPSMVKLVQLSICDPPAPEARVLPTAAVACRPYPCQASRTIADSSMPVLGRLHCVGSATLYATLLLRRGAGAFIVGITGLSYLRSALQSPCLCQVDFAMSGRSYCVESAKL
ncbi:hypothetical protein BHE74_00052947 [Ensete ventricosum]|nr:hypothetical protein BHE74_00052947 [Ensete ventricosum]